MQVYCWYYYYQSGMYFTSNQSGTDASTGDEKHINNPYYRYVFPPLYSSLYILLDRAEPNNRIQFDPSLNPSLQPCFRESDYFQKLPTFNALHLYIVLQREDYALLSKSLQLSEPDFETDKRRHDRAANVVDRYGNPLELSKRAPIEAFVQKYRSYVAPTTAKPVKIGQTRQSDQEGEVRNRGFDRFRLRGVAKF